MGLQDALNNSTSNTMCDSGSFSGGKDAAITTSPLSGWIGSHLQCVSCCHTRPIQNAPFLDIPVVPTSISSYLSGSMRGGMPLSPQSCTLHQCLNTFTSVERVREVECLSCAI